MFDVRYSLNSSLYASCDFDFDCELLFGPAVAAPPPPPRDMAPAAAPTAAAAAAAVVLPAVDGGVVVAAIVATVAAPPVDVIDGLRKCPAISREPCWFMGSILALVACRCVPAHSTMRQRFGCHQQGVMVQ